MEKKKVKTYSIFDFDILCSTNHWDDNNVEELKDVAFISIICSDECQKCYLEEEEEHWFKQEHPNVLNIEFDDVIEDMTYKGCRFVAITKPQAKKMFDFIERNIGKEFKIHCRAGISRSGAVYTFINEMYPHLYVVNENDKARIRPNTYVLTMLKRCYYEKYGFVKNEKEEE